MASRIELKVSHTLPIDEAVARIAALAEYYQHRHHATITWTDRVVHIEVRYLGVRIDARAAVEADAVRCDATDPGFLLRARGIKYMTTKLRRYLDAPTLTELPRS